jgi:hypothetical protein
MASKASAFMISVTGAPRKTLEIAVLRQPGGPADGPLGVHRLDDAGQDVAVGIVHVKDGEPDGRTGARRAGKRTDGRQAEKQEQEQGRPGK